MLTRAFFSKELVGALSFFWLPNVFGCMGCFLSAFSLAFLASCCSCKAALDGIHVACTCAAANAHLLLHLPITVQSRVELSALRVMGVPCAVVQLCTLVPFFSFPFLSKSLVMMAVYLWSRNFPNQNVSIMGLFTVPVRATLCITLLPAVYVPLCRFMR